MVFRTHDGNPLLVNDKLLFFGNRKYIFDGNEGRGTFELLMSQGTFFSIINHSIPYFDGVPGREKLKRARREVAVLKLITDSIICAAWVTDWPGTSLAKPPRLAIFAELDEIQRNYLFEECSSVFWKGFHKWEDLIIYHNRQILFWECFHERTACVYGSEKFLDSLGLAGKLFNFDSEDHMVSGVELPKQILK